MERFNERVYYLLTINRTELIHQFAFGGLVVGGYILTTLIATMMKVTHWSNLIVGFMALLLFGAVLWWLDRNRLVDAKSLERSAAAGIVAAEADEAVEEIIKSEDELRIESTEEELLEFTFMDSIEEVYQKRDSEKLSELLSNKHKFMLEEVNKCQLS